MGSTKVFGMVKGSRQTAWGFGRDAKGLRQITRKRKVAVLSLPLERAFIHVYSVLGDLPTLISDIFHSRPSH